MSQTYKVTVHSNRTEWCKPNTTTLHRLDGPAVEWKDGAKEWRVEGKLHRLDGPAIEWNDGGKEYWLDGKHLTEEKFLALTQPKAEPSCDGKTVEIDGKKYVLKQV